MSIGGHSVTAPSAQDEITNLNKEYTFFSWAVQNTVNPIHAVRGDGVYFWKPAGKRFLDFNSQLMNVNLGHGNRYVMVAFKHLPEPLSCLYPCIAPDPRAR